MSIGSSKQIVRNQQFDEDDGEDIKSDSTASSSDAVSIDIIIIHSLIKH